MIKQTKKIMNPKHPRWQEFIDRLQSKEGCDFKEDDKGKVTWKCKGEQDKSFARKILSKMGKTIDTDGSLKYFEEHGGYCDCEIVFNVK